MCVYISYSSLSLGHPIDSECLMSARMASLMGSNRFTSMLENLLRRTISESSAICFHSWLECVLHPICVSVGLMMQRYPSISRMVMPVPVSRARRKMAWRILFAPKKDVYAQLVWEKLACERMACSRLACERSAHVKSASVSLACLKFAW